MPDRNCPNCGNKLPEIMQFTKMVDCDACGTTLLLDDDEMRMAGERGVMAEVPSLLALGETVKVGRRIMTPVGHIRFDYGRGWWDEFWCLDEHGIGHWLSVDEGDYAFETELSDVPTFAWGGIEYRESRYTASETDEATCVAFRGQLPEVIAIGETHRYTDYTNADGKLISHEKWNGGEAWFGGEWLDPWSIWSAS